MTELFKQQLDKGGLRTKDEIIADGKLHRFFIQGDRPGSKNGWYVLFGDGIPAGAFGSWKTGFKGTWCAKAENTLSPAEHREFSDTIKKAQKIREAEEQARQNEAREKAAARWGFSPAAPDNHPYLLKKGVRNYGLRQHNGTLVIPLEDSYGILHSLQFIDDNGNKRFLSGGRKKGCYFLIGSPVDSLCIAEGYATAASIHESTGLPVAVAFDAGNLQAVALVLRERFPEIKISLCADNDETIPGNPGLTKAREAAAAIGALLAIPPCGGDFNDLFQNGQSGRESIMKSIAEAENILHDRVQDEGGEDVKKQNQASLLVAFVESRMDLFHDQNRAAYAQNRETGEVCRIEGGQFRDWLTAEFYRAENKAARDQSIREAISTLSGLARIRGDCREVHIRVALHEGCYYLDLAEKGQNRAVRIQPGRWDIVTGPPVSFIHPESMRALPEPKAGGDVKKLWNIVNAPVDSRILILAWLMECLRPDTPFPILEIIGEQGSAKSTTQAALRRIIDPNACDLRAAPKTVEDVFVSAGVNWLVSYENISHLPAPMQDTLCVLATGGGFAKRKMYSDADESIITVKRPVILNGISVAVTAQDLIDRTVSMELPVIQFREETTSLWQQFDAEQAEILGGLLDLMAKALELLPGVYLSPDERPRLVEFARFGTALSKAVGADSDFMQQFTAMRQEAVARTLDASPVATALLEWFDSRGRSSVEMAIKDLAYTVEQKRPLGAEAWPRTPKGFGDALRRAAPALRQSGIECRSLGKIGGVIKWKISGIEKSTDTKSCMSCKS